MCGLTAFLALQGLPASRESSHEHTSNMEVALEASMEIVKHRGPDARGHWLSDDLQVGKWFSLFPPNRKPRDIFGARFTISSLLN